MEHTELSLGPPRSISILSESTNSSPSESDAIYARKRKQTWYDPVSQSSNLDLQLNNPLPLDWEQCLDLQSGNMYYLNRNTMKKSWIRPREQEMDLELNISTFPSKERKANSTAHGTKKQYSSGGNMVALVCVNCHLLVMLCKSSPSCPNCKYLHSLPPPAAQEQPLPPSPHRKLQLEPAEPLETLSLLH